VCTSLPDPSGFPVKIVFVVDQSGSMCISDPPGAGVGLAFCNDAANAGVIPPGITTPARVRALQTLLNQFRGEPNVTVSLVPFETNVQNPWPRTTDSCQRFGRPDGELDRAVSDLQNTLGKGTDYQGALSYAYNVISGDIECVSKSRPELLPRTRYLVVFL